MKYFLLLIVLFAFEGFAGVAADTVKAKGTVLVMKDTTQFNKGIRFSATDDLLKTYKRGTFPCSLKTDDVTVQQIVTASYEMIGNMVFISIPKINGTSNSANLKLYCQLPTAIKPTYQRFGWCAVTDNNVGGIPGFWVINFISSSYITFYTNSFNFTTSGVKGVGTTATGSESTLYYVKN